MPHFTWTFHIQVCNIWYYCACHVTFFYYQITILLFFPFLSSLFIKKKKDNSVNLLLKGDMDYNFFFKWYFFKISCTEVIFFKFSQKTFEKNFILFGLSRLEIGLRLYIYKRGNCKTRSFLMPHNNLCLKLYALFVFTLCL